MKILSILAFAILSLVIRVHSATPVIVTSAPNIPEYLEDISVTVTTGYGSGSGVILSRVNSNGDIVNFVWTAGHVIAESRSEREVIAHDGSKRTIVELKDAHVVKELREGGRIVGRLEIDAQVLKYSDPDDGDDLALLMLRKHGFIKSSVRFYLDNDLPLLGADLYHVGSLLGGMGANSLTTGIISQTGRILDRHVYDQTSCTAFPGSSGGGVFLKDGRYVGMLVRGAGETFNLIVPVRRMHEFAERNKVLWAIDPSIALPNESEIEHLPIEDALPVALDAKADKTK